MSISLNQPQSHAQASLAQRKTMQPISLKPITSIIDQIISLVNIFLKIIFPIGGYSLFPLCLLS
jgi:hypothetical protein